MVSTVDRYQVGRYTDTVWTNATFYLGLQLDGFTTYNNISEELEQYGTITVYSPPTFPTQEQQQIEFVKGEPITIQVHKVGGIYSNSS